MLSTWQLFFNIEPWGNAFQVSEVDDSDSVSNGAVSPGSVSSSTSKKLERQVNEEVRATMAVIFPSLETELNNFISFLDKIDSL